MTNDTRTGGVPGDRVTAAEHGERTEALKAGGEAAEVALRRRDAAAGGRRQLRVARHQPRTDGAETMARIELIERSSQQLVPAAPPGQRLAHAVPQGRGQFRHVPAAERQASGEARVTRPRLQ